MNKEVRTRTSLGLHNDEDEPEKQFFFSLSWSLWRDEAAITTGSSTHLDKQTLDDPSSDRISKIKEETCQMKVFIPHYKNEHRVPQHRSTIFYSLRIMYLFVFTASSSIFTSVKENRGLDLNPALPPILKSSSSSCQEADMVDLLLLGWPPTTQLGVHCDPPPGDSFIQNQLQAWTDSSRLTAPG